jgi:hypothetical protein
VGSRQVDKVDQQGEQVSDQAADVEKLMRDMYFGDGKDNPPMTTRMKTLEDVVAGLQKFAWAIVLMLISLVGKGVYDLLSIHIH